MAIIDKLKKDRLAELKISTLHNPNFYIADDCVFEPPCSIKWMNIHNRLRIGAFSYAVSGYYHDAVIGRYVSIGEQVQVGRGSHPVSWASTSPVFYTNPLNVLDLHNPQADVVSFKVPHLESRPTIIGNDVYIGHGAFIMQGVQIGNGAVVGACSVVTKNVPPYAVVAGSPAVIKRMRFSDRIVDRMIEISWWRFAFWELSGANTSDPEQFLDFVEMKIENGISSYSPKTVRLRDLV